MPSPSSLSPSSPHSIGGQRETHRRQADDAGAGAAPGQARQEEAGRGGGREHQRNEKSEADARSSLSPCPHSSLPSPPRACPKPSLPPLHADRPHQSRPGCGAADCCRARRPPRRHAGKRGWRRGERKREEGGGRRAGGGLPSPPACGSACAAPVSARSAGSAGQFPPQAGARRGGTSNGTGSEAVRPRPCPRAGVGREECGTLAGARPSPRGAASARPGRRARRRRRPFRAPSPRVAGAASPTSAPPGRPPGLRPRRPGCGRGL